MHKENFMPLLYNKVVDITRFSSADLYCTGLIKLVWIANTLVVISQAIAYTLLRYRNSKAIFLSSYMKDTAHVMHNFHMPLLLEAWKPISFGHKRRQSFCHF